MACYVGAYFSLAESKYTGIYRTVEGQWPKAVVYPIGHNTSLGKGRTYSADSYTHPFFYPINAIDRRIRHDHWHESTNWWVDSAVD